MDSNFYGLTDELKRDLKKFLDAMKLKKYEMAYHHLNGVKEICEYILPLIKPVQKWKNTFLILSISVQSF